MKNKIEKCINCKLCTKNCDFLEKYNMDLNIRAEQVPDYIFADISNEIGE